VIKLDAIQAIKTRRSIRRYKKDVIPDEIIKELLEAAMSGPSTANQRPWQFLVITDPKILAEIPKVHPGAPYAPNAPLAILVCGDMELEKFPGFWIIDCSIAAQNLLIAAQAKGLGAVWTGIYPMKQRISGIKELLKLPENIIPLALIPIGYPAEQLNVEDRYEASRVHYNKF
jgi:nitroreductase